MVFLRLLTLGALGAIVVEVSLFAWRHSGAWWLVAGGAGLAYAAFLSGVFFGDKNIWLAKLFQTAMESTFFSLPIAAAATLCCVGVAIAGGVYLTQTWAYQLTIQVAAANSGSGDRRPAVEVIVKRVSPDVTQPRFLHTDSDGVATFPVELNHVLNIWVRLERQGRLQEAEVEPRKIEKVPDFKRIEVSQIVAERWIQVQKTAAPAAPKVAFEAGLKAPSGISALQAVREIDPKQHAPWGLPEAAITLHRIAYSLGYDSANKIPRWVAYRVYPTSPDYRRPTESFRPDPAIPPDHQASADDYRGNPYDRGAMLSGLDISILGADAVRTVFYLSIAVPQARQMNRRTWLFLEQYTRQLAANGEPIYVISGPAFQSGLNVKGIFVIGNGRVAVPTHLFRILARKATNGAVEALAFLVPNEDGLPDDYNKYRTSVGAIEQATGLRFFPDLSDENRQRIIPDATSTLWPPSVPH